MATNFVVFQAYGKEEILNEALVSIASIYKTTDVVTRPQMLVFTDSVAYLSKFLPEEVNLIEVPKSKWQEWKGNLDFVHRAKIEMLRHFSSQFQGSVLYCDTDTYFLKNPIEIFQKIEQGNLIMHVDEGALRGSKNLVFRKLEKFLRNYRFQGKSIPSETHMWNAGVLGFSTNNSEILDEVLALSDDLYQAFQKHVMEQLAFSVRFQQKQRFSCDEYIFHYWDFKEYRSLLADFFKKHQDSKFDVWSAEIEKYTPMSLFKTKQKYLSRPYLLRKFWKLIGKGYQIPKINDL